MKEILEGRKRGEVDKGKESQIYGNGRKFNFQW